MIVAFSPIWGVTLALGLGQNYTTSMWATLPILGGMTACVFDCCTGARLQLLLEMYLPKFAFMEWIAQSRVTPCIIGPARNTNCTDLRVGDVGSFNNQKAKTKITEYPRSLAVLPETAATEVMESASSAQ